MLIAYIWKLGWCFNSLYKFIEHVLVVSQTAEEVSFAANGITAAGIKAFDGVLQSNIVLNTLNLSGNPIGDEGVKVSSSHVTTVFNLI